MPNNILEKFNPVTEADIRRREEFDALSPEAQQAETNRLHDGADIENVDSFKTLLETTTDPEKRAELELALNVCNVIKEAGGLALVVGGFARDAALNKHGYDLESKDFDIEVYGVEFEKLKVLLASLGRVDIVGEAFQVFKLNGKLDISIPRRDSKTGAGHKGFTVTGDPNMLVKEAALRRDFTINALALDPLTGEILDFYGGIEDIKNKILRATDSKTFVEDPLRVLRAMQFVGRFGFTIDPETADLCRSLDLKKLSKERIGEEWLKLLEKSPKPSIGMQAAMELGILEQLHPEVRALEGVPQSPKYHPEGDVWTHVKMVADAAVKVAQEEHLDDEHKQVLMLAALCHDLGKPITTVTQPDGKITSYEHETEGLPLAERFLESLKIKKETINKVLLLTRYHMRIHHDDNWTDSAVRRLARNLSPVTINDLANLARSDINGTTQLRFEGGRYPAAEALVARAEELSVKDSKPVPIIMGRDLLAIGFKPGPIVGETTREIEELQLDGHVTTKEQAIDYARVKMHTIELQNYGLGGLEGRILRGLDPAGMLAVKETRRLVEEILAKTGINIVDVERLTKELHVGAVWTRADDLARAEKPEVRAWMLLADQCREKNDQDLSREEYLSDVERIKREFESAIADPQSALDKAVEKIVGTAKEKFIIKDSAAFSEEDAFIYMAIAGEKSGVCKAGDLYFAGANELDYSILEAQGLVAVEREDRGRLVTFYQKDGVDVVKKLYPGLAIVFGDEKLALELAKAAKIS